MALSAADILPLARVKQELDILPDVTDQDDYLVALAAAAVDAIATHLGLPLIRQADRYAVPFPGIPERPVVLRATAVTEIIALRWHEPGQMLSDEPDGHVAGDALRTLASLQFISVYPPDGRWPSVLADSLLLLDVVRDVAEPPPAAVQAALVALRQLYDGHVFNPSGAIFNLLGATRDAVKRGDLPVASLTPPAPPEGGTAPGTVTLRGEVVTLRGQS